VKAFWPRFWVTAGYLGLLPWAPGTCGSLGGVALALAAARYAGAPRIQAALLLGLILLFGGVTLIYGEWAERAFGRKDPPQVVSDEVAGLR
jgi:phosphatidylglycerophosphatase A